MTRVLSILIVCVLAGVTACSSSDSDSGNDVRDENKVDLSPLATTLEHPPTAGKLPVDLQPPI